MATVINGTDNTAATPALTGTDTDTGVFFPAANTMAFSTGGTEQMRVDSAGNLGVGTTTPTARVHAEASNPTRGILSRVRNSASTSQTGAQIQLTQNGIEDWAIGQPAATNAFAFWSGRSESADGTERMRIDSSGNVLVGQTASGGNQAAGGIALRNPAVGSGGSSILLSHATGTADGNSFAEFSLGGSGIGNIVQSTASTVAFNTSSDYRLKEDIAPMTGALNKVSALKPVTYKWKVDGSDGQGFIAHELQEVVPDCVSGEKDAVETVDEFDADGKKIGTKEVPKYQGIDTSFLVATLTAAIQELKATVDAQAARIAALENPPVES
jgi:hypothetical protein